MDSTNGNETAAGRLRSHGLRVTPQRRVILAVFDETAEDEGHLSADQVLERASEQLPELARATVYNTLNELSRGGLLRRVEGRGPVLYDRNLDEAHHHFRCVECDRLFDVVPRGTDALALSSGFKVERAEIMFEGRCADCAEPTRRSA